MSMNQYMHPRNIYKQPPDFKQLALEYPEFRKYVQTDITGKISVDFKNLDALRALSCTLLKKDFGLNVEIPSNKLIPTIPLRLNYILWIEDLLTLTDNKDVVKGIDIGTGASCVYPLIIAKKYEWYMVATEIDKDSIKYATKNIEQNSLNEFIKIVEVNKDTLLKKVLTIEPDDFDFCMCNPPFFSSPQELHPFFKSRKQNRPHPKNAFVATMNEVVSKGGEVEYISKLIEESKNFMDRIKIFTTMVGHKSSLPPLKKLLRDSGVVSFKQMEFCQGNTTRWGLAWTYIDIDLRKIPGPLAAAKKQQPKPLVYAIPKNETIPYKFNNIYERLIKIFDDLQIDHKEIKHIKNYVELIITAYSNTWSHQRRKRREKLQSIDSVNPPTTIEIDHTCNQLAELNIPKQQQVSDDETRTSTKKKRSFDSDEGYYDVKKLRTGLDEFDSDKIFLKAQISLILDDECIGLEMRFLEGNGTKETLHQILQYIKNNFYKSD